MNSGEGKRHKEYPKFDPNIHLITDLTAPLRYRCDLKKLDIFSPECKSYLEPLSSKCFPIFTPECIKIIQWELNNWLATKDKCDNLKQFFKDKTFSFLNFESPTLSNCLTLLPFIHDTFTHEETIRILSFHVGFQLDVVMDYEIAHFAKKIDNATKSHIAKLNLGESSKIIIRKKSVAYPYVCLIKLNPHDISPSVPIGYGFFLKGRLIENLAGKIIYTKNSPNEVVLCPSYVPGQIKLYEDLKDRKQRTKMTKRMKNGPSNINSNKTNDSSLCISTNSKFYKDVRALETDSNTEKIEQYTTWLNRYYMNGA